MRQSTLTFGVLLFMFVVFITVRGQLPAYLALFRSKKVGESSSSSMGNSFTGGGGSFGGGGSTGDWGDATSSGGDASSLDNADLGSSFNSLEAI